MAGIGAPTLLVRGRGSEHGYAFKPSEARALSQADLIVWVGESLETFMTKPLSSLPNKVRVLEVSAIADLRRLKPRAGGVWDSHDNHGHGHGKKPSAKQDHGAEIDGHVWLDIDNAKLIVGAIARALGEIDGVNRAAYERNAAAVRDGLEVLDAELRARLASVREHPYIVFHDAYQYFEHRYGLSAAGSITVHPENKPSARRLSQIRAKIVELKARCAFSEPQYNAALVRTAVEGTSARMGALDPIGADLAEGPDAYAQMMRNLAANLIGCLGAPG
jgi:zinc transport system substrate-binding protein